MLKIVKQQISISTFHPLHAKLDYRLRRNQVLFAEAVQSWFAFTTKQIQTELRNKFQKDVTSELTDWEYLDEHGKQILKPATLKVMQSGGNEAYKALQVSGAFDVLNVNAVKAADNFTADLVRQVNADTKKGIRSHISQGIKDGKSMDKLARELRPLVGLTANQTRSITNYRNLLGDEDKFPNLSASDIDKKVQRYSDKTHRRRMKTIVRTETARAQTIGYVMGMDDLGVLQLEFRVAPTDFCAICEGLNKTKYDIDTGAGMIPVHPNCRCVMLPVLGGKTINSSAQAAEAMPQHISDLVGRWENAKSRSNKWVLKDKLRKLGYDTSGSAIGIKPPPFVAPIIVTPVKPVVQLPQSIQDLITRWKNAKSRSAKWTYQNKLKKLGYNVRTGVYNPTGAALPTPKPAVSVKPKVPKGTAQYETAEEYRQALFNLEASKKTPAIQKELAELKAKRSALDKKNIDLRDKWVDAKHDGISTKAELDKMWDERQLLRKESDNIWRKEYKLKESVKLSKEEMRAVLNETTNLHGGIKDTMTIARRENGLSAVEAKKWESAADDILSWMPKKAFTASERRTISNLQVYKKPKLDSTLGQYTSQDMWGNVTETIEMFVSAPKTFAHEFGHHLSYKVKSIMKKQSKFFEARTAGETTKRVPGYSDKVRGKKDKFRNYDVYGGRTYSDGRAPEIISVGIEHIWTNPISAAKKDPEWFRMVISALKNIPYEPVL